MIARPDTAAMRIQSRIVCAGTRCELYSPPMIHRHYALLFALACPATVLAQSIENVGGRDEALVGGELEQYLRYLQSDGRAALYPWSIAGFSSGEIERILPADSAHPWARRYSLDSKERLPGFA